MTVLPGHDWPFAHGNDRAAALIEHHRQRLDALTLAAQKSPITTGDAMQVLFDRGFGPHEIFFASGEARAHLGYLVSTGQIESFFKGETEYFRPC
jgi:uncharacterized protein (DUF1786 family)